MPDRYVLFSDSELLAKRFKTDIPSGYQVNYNAAPTHLLPIITNDNPDGVSFFYWGLNPSWSKNKSISTKLINSRAESLSNTASYKKSLQKRRCLILANGYYEWKQIGKKTKVPYYVCLTSEEPFAMAGLWDEYEDENDEIIHTFSLITTENQEGSRVPAIINHEDEEKWLDDNLLEDELLELIHTIDEDKIKSHSVSSRINSLDAGGPELIKHTPPSDQYGNYTLFS